jgi:hypothetical protein
VRRGGVLGLCVLGVALGGPAGVAHAADVRACGSGDFVVLDGPTWPSGVAGMAHFTLRAASSRVSDPVTLATAATSDKLTGSVSPPAAANTGTGSATTSHDAKPGPGLTYTIVATATFATRQCQQRFAVSAVAPGTTPPTSWVGDFETGDLSQWDNIDGDQANASHYFNVVTSPTVSGSQFAFASTVDGSASSGDVGHRALVYLYPQDDAAQNRTGAYEGSERWYHTYLYFPASFVPEPNTTWNWVVEWHNWPNDACCANLAVGVDTTGGAEKLFLRSMGGGTPAHPIEETGTAYTNPAAHVDSFVGDATLDRGRWYDLLVHVKWSSNPANGLVEWWLDGHQVISKQTSTLFWYADNNQNFSGSTPGSGQAYYMEGYYRSGHLADGSPDTSLQTVFHDGARNGLSRASVGG